MSETTAETVANGVLRGTKFLEAFERGLINETVDAGTASFESINYAPLRDRIYVQRAGAYFRIVRSVAGRASVSAHAFQIDAISTCPNETPTVSEEPVAFDELPATDRRVFLVGIRDDYENDTCFGFSDRLVQYSSKTERESVFINESPTLVRYENDTYRVRYEGTEERTKKTFEFTAEELGATFEAYASGVVPEVVWHVTPSELPQSQREFFEELRQRSYYEKENPIPDGVFDFLRRVEDHAYSLEEFGPYFVEHDDTYYRFTYTDVMS